MDDRELRRRIYAQLAKDYCCSPGEAADGKNQFHVYVPLEGRRRFEERDEMFLKVMSFRNKLLFAGDEGIIDWCQSRFENTEGAWFMEAGIMRELDRKLADYGYCIDKVHPFFVPSPEALRGTDPSPKGEAVSSSYFSHPVKKDGYEIHYYRGDEILAFRGDKRFGNAFTFVETAPDVIGVAAFRAGQILGMAGASADSDTFWQIGIDVLPEARGLGIGRILVKLIRDEILACDRVPYYGTAVSHILSQNIAIGSGFRAVWTELTTAKIDET